MNDGGSVVAVELGFDRFTAETIVEACRAEGFDVEFLQMDESGIAPGVVALAPHRLLAREVDLDEVMQIVNRSFPQTEHDLEFASSMPRRRSRLVMMRLVAVAVFIVMFAPGIFMLIAGYL